MDNSKSLPKNGFENRMALKPYLSLIYVEVIPCFSLWITPVDNSLSFSEGPKLSPKTQNLSTAVYPPELSPVFLSISFK